MSHGRRRPRAHSSSSDERRVRRRRDEEEAAAALRTLGYEVEEESAEEAEEGEPTGDDDGGYQMDTGHRTVARLEALVQALETEPDNPELLAATKSEIRKLYLSNGGLPIDSRNPMPANLNEMSAEQLGNILQNMMIASVRSKSATFLDRALNTASNTIYLAGKHAGFDLSGNVVTELASDDLLKECAVQTFIGGLTKVNPLVGLTVCVASHATNLLVNYIHGSEQRALGAVPTNGQIALQTVEQPAQLAPGCVSTVIRV